MIISISIIFKLNRVNISDEEVGEMSYHERYDTLNKNPVLVARHIISGIKFNNEQYHQKLNPVFTLKMASCMCKPNI